MEEIRSGYSEDTQRESMEEAIIAPSASQSPQQR
jgi:hypothetical protein